VRGYNDSVRRERPGALFLGGGDDHEKGSVAELLSAGAATREATRAMRYHARVLGNHDFAWGAEALLDHARDPRAVTLASNLAWTGADRLAFAATDYAEFVVDGARVGLIGLVTMPWNERDEPAAADYPGFRGDWRFAEAARRVARTKGKDADILVLLSHLGREDDLKVAAAVEELDLVLGGHTHGWTWAPEKRGGAWVIESGHDAKFVARVDLDWDPAARRVCAVRHALHEVGPKTPASPRVQAEIAAIAQRHAPGAEAPSGCAARAATKESAAALAAEAAREELGADAALVDLKTVWTPWKKGPVDAQDFLDAFKVERQPPGTPGFNSFYKAFVMPGAWAQARAKLDRSRWVLSDRGAGAAVRVIVLPKRAALHAREVLGLELSEVRPAAEAWSVLDARARRRAAAKKCVDE
jgi:2',3'-cyclic-nucleotide 2'-phosphodiesterase (5'-nucleotidase family)